MAYLGPLLDELYEAPVAQFCADPEIFRIPGDEDGATGFMDT